jgi:hypothetical protein
MRQNETEKTDKKDDEHAVSYGNFSDARVSMVLGLAWISNTMKFRELQGSLTWKKFFMTVFELIGQFFFQNDIFKPKEVFSEHVIRIFLEKGLGSFQTFLILQI